MNNERRIELERRIVRKYVRVLLDAGYQILGRESGGEELFPKMAVMPSNDDLFACDDLVLKFGKAGVAGSAGHLYFVFGNSPDEVLNDYGGSDLDAIKALIAPADAYAEKVGG
jgi:hypothetical protein